MKLKSAALHYGTSRYDIFMPEQFETLPDGLLSEDVLSELLEAVSKAAGSGPNWRTISAEALRKRIRHHVVVDLSNNAALVAHCEESGTPLPPVTTQLLGDGFSVIYQH